MLDFLQSYGGLIVSGLLVILDIVILVLKKRPQIIDTSFMSKCIVWIDEAEKIFRYGPDKLSYVLTQAHNYLKDNFNEAEVTNIVEMILSLPSKKKGN